MVEEPVLNQPLQEFKREAERRAVAEQALSDWQAKERVRRALNSRTRPTCNYMPEDLVYFWRTQAAGKSNKHPGTLHGRFLGPARILAMESRQGPGNESRPGNAIWIVRGRRLLKCSREQLRPASPREEAVESLTPEGQAPWTFSRVANEVGGSQYEDISNEVPTEAEWSRAQDVFEEIPPVTHRVRSKRPAAEPLDELEIHSDEETETMGQGGSQPSNLRRRRQNQGAAATTEPAKAWWCEVEPNAWEPEASAFWTEDSAAVAVEIAMPESPQAMSKASQNLQSYFVGALKRRAVEVSEKRLSQEDKQKFREAKAIEVRNFIAAQAFEALPPNVRLSKDQAISMRWILTWKVQDNGDLKPKARAVLLGYQDPITSTGRQQLQ